MTYINYVNQFWEVTKLGSLPSSAIALYFYLLNACNSCRWKMPFSCSSSVVCESLRISRQTFCTARQCLIDKGLISCVEGKSRYANPKYCILEWSDNQTEYQTECLNVDLTVDQTDGVTPIILKDVDIDKEGDNNSMSSCNADISSLPPMHKEDLIDFVALMEFFNCSVKDRQIPPIRKISNKRRGMIRARIREHGKEAIAELIRKAAASDFLNGGSGTFIASFDWLFKPNNFLKVLEGNYDNNNSKFNNNGRQKHFTNNSCDRRSLEDIYCGAARVIANLEKEAHQPQEDIPVV